MSNSGIDESAAENMREVKYTIGGDFAGILGSLNAALLISTYQAGKLVVVSSSGEELRFAFHNFDRPMGMAVCKNRIAVGTRHQVWFLQNAADIADRLQPMGEHDACFLTRACHFTDEIQVHEMAWGDDKNASDELWIVNTLFSCLCTLSPRYNFIPRWKPKFISKLAAEDRCHLNGLAVVDGQPKYVTALAATDTAEGWRPHKSDGGCLIDVESNETIASGFSMPHSPRVHRDKLYLLNSGTGTLVTADRNSGHVTPIEVLPGFLRGLAMRDRYAFVGLSKIREMQTFGGLPISDRADELRCGVGIVDLASGRSVASLEFTAGVDEIFDVQLTTGQCHPDVVGPLASAEGRSPVWYLPSANLPAVDHERETQSQTNPSHPATPIYRSMNQFQWESPQSVVGWQLDRLRNLLLHCNQHLPYYRELFAKHRIHPEKIQSIDDLRRIPILERDELQRNAPAFLADELPPGHQTIGCSHTSGTTGVPIQVHATNRVANWWLASFLRDLDWAGIDPRGRLAAIRKVSEGPISECPNAAELLQGVQLPNWGAAFEEFLTTGPSQLMDVLQDPRVQLQWLARTEPNYILSYPSNLVALASLTAETKTRFTNLKAIQAIAEELTDEMRMQIESAFGVPVKNSYTCEEAGYLASPCPTSDNYHVHADNVLMEVINANGEPCGPGETGRVILTTLHNYQMPLLRYAIGDSVELAAAPCSCGRGLPAIRRVIGKQRPPVILSDGRQKSSHVLAGYLREIGGFHQFQFVQHTPGSVTLRVVPDRQWTEQHPQRLQNMLRDFLEQATLTIKIESLERIPPTSGGKLQSFVCEISRSL